MSVDAMTNARLYTGFTRASAFDELVTYDLKRHRISHQPVWKGDFWETVATTGPITQSFRKSGDVNGNVYRHDWGLGPYGAGEGPERFFSIVVNEKNVQAFEDFLKDRGDRRSAWKLRAMFPEIFYFDHDALHRRIVRRIAQLRFI